MRIFACLIFSHFSLSSALSAQLTEKSCPADVILDSNVSNRLPWTDGPGCDNKPQRRRNHWLYTLQK